MTARVEDQVHTRGVLICHRANQSGPITIEFTYWADVAEARQAEAELAQTCGPYCIGVHTVVRIDAIARTRPGANRPPGLRPRQRAPATSPQALTAPRAGDPSPRPAPHLTA